MHRQQFMGPNNCNHSSGGSMQHQQDFADFNCLGDKIPHPKHLPLPQNLQSHSRKKNSNSLRSPSPWNHTYTEIHDGRMHRGFVLEDDPVYEEIERSDIQVSDMSDEDGKRQSDMSRQSSRSYGDHRPLIPYSPATDRNIQACLENAAKHNKDHSRYLPPDIEQYHSHRMVRQNMHRGDARSLAAVLDGETVVCHLEPQEIFLHDPYSARTLVLPQYGDS